MEAVNVENDFAPRLRYHPRRSQEPVSRSVQGEAAVKGFILEGAENPSPLGDGMNATH